MIRRRKARVDNRTIFALIQKELIPQARRVFPEIKFDRKFIMNRLKKNINFVAETEKRGKMVGFISMFTNKDRLCIDMLAVDRSMQGQGWGSELLKWAETYGMEKGCREATLFVDSANDQAVQFYTHRGYQQDRYFEHTKCYLYRKDLIPQPMYGFI